MAEKVPKLVFSKSITFDETAKSGSQKQVQLPIIENGFICVLIDELPSQPDSIIYITLTSYINVFGKYNHNATGTIILRPNGTVGSDSSASGYNRNTGILTLGGTYGYYPQGMTYNIYAFEIGDSD
ncbi:MAG: hypothetical protein IKG23_08535 [Clostridia bacterium]|nr:hypothetical protein [Clostridia bacterium]